jgi:hypothetical protein
MSDLSSAAHPSPKGDLWCWPHLVAHLALPGQLHVLGRCPVRAYSTYACAVCVHGQLVDVLTYLRRGLFPRRPSSSCSGLCSHSHDTCLRMCAVWPRSQYQSYHARTKAVTTPKPSTSAFRPRGPRRCCSACLSRSCRRPSYTRGSWLRGQWLLVDCMSTAWPWPQPPNRSALAC